MKTKVLHAIASFDELVVEFSYIDSKGQRTRRVASPIRMAGKDRFLALCLSREEPRQFYLDRCEDMVVRSASEYLMPVPILTLAGIGG